MLEPMGKTMKEYTEREWNRKPTLEWSTVPTMESLAVSRRSKFEFGINYSFYYATVGNLARRVLVTILCNYASINTSNIIYNSSARSLSFPSPMFPILPPIPMQSRRTRSRNCGSLGRHTEACPVCIGTDLDRLNEST